MENNLNDLNKFLFDTLRDVKEDKINLKKAQVIAGLSNTIIANAKTQLSAYKMTKGKAYKDTFGELEAPSPQALESGDKYTQMNEFALTKGYKSVTDAMSKMGKHQFEQEFKEWIKKAS